MPQASLTSVMQAYAADAVDIAYESFSVELDFSEQSVASIEQILASYEDSLPRGVMGRMFGSQPSQENLWLLARIWGAYIGETLRRRWGGEWLSETGSYRGREITLQIGAQQLHPPVRVYNRLLYGIQANVHQYFQVLSDDLAKTVAPQPDTMLTAIESAAKPKPNVIRANIEA